MAGERPPREVWRPHADHGPGRWLAALDAGAPTSFATDQRGLPRVDGSARNLGACELQRAKPDLQIVSLTTTNNKAPQGQKVTLTVVVKNTG